MKKQKKINPVKHNKLMAEFMDFEKVYKGYNWKGLGWFPSNNLFFHHDYSWLMKVWEKIESLPHINTHIIHHADKPVKHIVSISTMVEGKYGMLLGEGYSESSKLDAMYIAVINFIEWFNKENKLLND